MPGYLGAIAPCVFLDSAIRPGNARSTPLSALVLVPDSRVDDAIDQIHQEIHCSQKHSVEEHHGQDHRLIFDLHARNKKFAHTRNIENLLDEEGTRPDGSKDWPDQRHHRYECVLEHVLRHYSLISQAFSACRPYEIGTDDFNHAGTRVSRQRCQRRGSYSNGGQYPVQGALPASYAES